MNKKTAIITSLAATSFLGITAIATVSMVNELNNRHTMSQNELALTASGLVGQSGLTAQLPDLPQVNDLPLSQQLTSAASSINQSDLNLSIGTAEQLVLAATGGKLQASADTVKKGIAAYAITVLRTDQSVITGFVDKASGTIFDWEIVKKGGTVANYDDDDDDDDRYEDDDEYEDDDYDEDEYEDDDD